MSSYQPLRPLTRRGLLQLGSGAIVGAAGVVGLSQVSEAAAVKAKPAKKKSASKKEDRQPNEFKKMVALGESTTAGGWSTSPERCWVPVLAGLINDFQSKKMAFVNSGIGANVVSTRSPAYEKSGKPAANERLGKHVIDHHPDLLIISYGLNDARGGTPLELFRTELVSVVQRVREKIQPVIVLLGPYFMNDFTVGGKR